MTDFPPKINDIPREKIKPPVIEQVLSGNSEILRGVLKNEKYVSAILSSNIDEIKKLSEEIKFIEKLKKLPDYEGSRLKEVIEQGKLEIIKTKPVYFKKQKLEIQVKDSKYALYEKGGNLLYFVNLNGEKYFNVDGVRKGVARGTIENRLDGYFGGKQVLENGIYNIYIGDRKIDINSEEYREMLLICGESVIQLKKKLEELYEEKKGGN